MALEGQEPLSAFTTLDGPYSSSDSDYELWTAAARAFGLAANASKIVTSAMYRRLDTPSGFLLDTFHANDSSDSFDDCQYEPNEYLEEKFGLVTVFGTCVCVIGFIHNCLLVHVLSRSSLIKTHVFYLAVLAVCDIVTEFSYIAVMSIQVLFDYARNFDLYVAWNKYLRAVFTATHVSLTIATYMIVAASAERYMASSSFVRGTCTKRHRWLVTFGVCIFAFLSKGLVYWEIEVVYRPNCTGFGIYVVQPSSLAMDPPYKVGYTLWFRHIAHVFFPFVLLLCLNGAILSRLKRRPLERVQAALVATTMGQLVRERKKRIRDATLMLGATASTYLVSNLLNVVITLWEHIDLPFLTSQFKFYTFAADVITLLTVFTGAIRFPIYCICNQQLRLELRRLFKSWVRGGRDMLRGIRKRFCFEAKDKKDNGYIECIDEEDNQNIVLEMGPDMTTALTASL